MAQALINTNSPKVDKSGCIAYRTSREATFVKLFAFKNRNMAQASPSTVTGLDMGNAWANIQGAATRSERLEQKYAGYDAWLLRCDIKATKPPSSNTFLQILPCKALIVLKWRGKRHHANVEYPTVNVGSCATATHGMILIDIKKDIKTPDPDLTGKEPILWRQFGLDGGKRHLILRLSLITNKDLAAAGFHWSTLKDDVTGEAYIYKIDRIIVLEKKETAPLPSASAAPNATSSTAPLSEGAQPSSNA